MNFKEYQEKIKTTAIYPDDMNVIYPTLGLCGEAGEVAEKVKKVFRDNNGYFTQSKKEEITKELGDVLWYIQAICNDLGINMQDVAEQNVEKLLSRKDRGVLQGSGDER